MHEAESRWSWRRRDVPPLLGVEDLRRGQTSSLPGGVHLPVTAPPRRDECTDWLLIGKRREYTVDRSGALRLRAAIDAGHISPPAEPLLADLTNRDLGLISAAERERCHPNA